MRSARFVSFIVGIVLAASPGAHASNTPCAEKTYAGENKIEIGDFAGARPILEEAVKICTVSPKEKSARPYLALGKVYYELKQYPEAIEQFEKALTKEPKLALALMDLGASYMAMEQLDKAREYSIKAASTKSDKHTLMQANFNAGLACVKIAAAKNNPKDKSGEPFFKKSRDLDPSYGGNYFYLGVYKESADHDLKAAKDLYKQGCDRKYQQACQFLASADSRAGKEGGERVPASAAKEK